MDLTDKDVCKILGAINRKLSELGYEWRSDAESGDCGLAHGDTPYTAGQTRLEDAVYSVQGLLRKKR